jgi:uncharacterized protein YkwD
MQNTITLQPMSISLPTEKIVVGALIVAAAVALIGVTVLTKPATAIDLPNQDEQTLITLTNQERTKHGLKSLTYNKKLQAAAEAKAYDMLNKDYFDHVSPDGVTPWKFIDKSGYAYTKAGENLAIDFQTVAGAVPAWMDSPTHRANILKAEYKETGIARVKGEYQGRQTVVVVQIFGTQSSGLARLVSK